jgi:predicted dienelactone hydrolase
VTALLDLLSKNPYWRSQLNLRRVGVLGHSLGGYTALALGGTRVNWRPFQQACARAESHEQLVFNLSIL